MTLLRLIQTASILAGMTLASLAVNSNPAHADTAQFCVIANNGKTACGPLQAVERACVTTDAGSVVCGKYKSIRAEQAQAETQTPTPIAGYRKELDGMTFLLRSCRRSSSDIKCNFVITTKKENKFINIYAGKGSSSIVDSAGRTYPSSTVEYNASSSTNRGLNMSPGIDYVIDVNFENIPGQITQASLLNISNSTGKVIQFRNVPFSN